MLVCTDNGVWWCSNSWLHWLLRPCVGEVLLCVPGWSSIGWMHGRHSIFFRTWHPRLHDLLTPPGRRHWGVHLWPHGWVNFTSRPGRGVGQDQVTRCCDTGYLYIQQVWAWCKPHTPWTTSLRADWECSWVWLAKLDRRTPYPAAGGYCGFHMVLTCCGPQYALAGVWFAQYAPRSPVQAYKSSLLESKYSKDYTWRAANLEERVADWHFALLGLR